MSTATLDKICAAAVEDARTAAVAVAPAGEVGDWTEAHADEDRVVTHYFASRSSSYIGWRWAVTVTRASRARTATVAEVVLLPGDGSLLAPTWVPWVERIAPGDLGAGDLLPPSADDPRLEPGYTGSDALAEADGTAGDAPLRPEQWQLGLGRSQVLSAWGRDDAAMRWHDGDFGPDSAMAKAAPAHCGSCGFLLPVGGSLGQQFGLCGNAMAPADGRVVDLGYGCGAHSATPVIEGTGVLVSAGFVDEGGYDIEPTSDAAAADPADTAVAATD